VAEPAPFTSMFTAMGTPDLVLDADSVPTPGEPGATGTSNYRINSTDDIICYDITLPGVTPPFQSPARTATHIHEGAVGQAGPPRLAFPNPEGSGDPLTSEGCTQGPITTGTGSTLDRIEADPAAFFTDSHAATFTAGALCGQLTAMPEGGVETGAGGTSDSGWAPAAFRGTRGVLVGVWTAAVVSGCATVPASAVAVAPVPSAVGTCLVRTAHRIRRLHCRRCMRTGRRERSEGPVG